MRYSKSQLSNEAFCNLANRKSSIVSALKRTVELFGGCWMVTRESEKSMRIEMRFFEQHDYNQVFEHLLAALKPVENGCKVSPRWETESQNVVLIYYATFLDQSNELTPKGGRIA